MYILVLLSVIGASTAHLCLLSPAQRGGVPSPLNGGDNACFLRSAPCGGMGKGTSSGSYAAGSNIAVTWQKNIDHFNKANPGFMEVSLMKADNGVITRVGDAVKVTDTRAAHHGTTDFTKNIQIPANFHGNHLIVQVMYQSNSPDAAGKDYTFYQCADVTITH